MTYDPPTPNVGFELPTLGTGQKWESAVVKDYFEKIDAKFGDVDEQIATEWQNYSPNYTNLVPGNGVVRAKYRQVGARVEVEYAIQLGTTSLIGSGPVIGFPPVPVADWLTNGPLPVTPVLGFGQLEDSSQSSSGRFDAEVLYAAAGFRLGYRAAEAGAVKWGAVTAALPFVWSNLSTDADRLSFSASYPTA